MLAFFEEDDFAEDPACLWRTLPQLHDFFDSDIAAVLLPGGLRNVAIRSLANNLLYFVFLIEILERKDLIDVRGESFGF